jgi:glycosyltransferase involved in cell wall biosynthesis
MVHCGVDSEKFKPLKKDASGKIRIGYLGGLDGRKNVILLVDCFKELLKNYDNIELHIYGTGKNYNKFKEMNLPRMFLHGEIKYEDITTFLNSLDVFVFPTLGEGFGLPVCEAMACGIPVVASNVTTMPEIVGDGGLLTSPNVKDMSEAISRLVSDESLRKRMSDKALEKSRDFSWSKAAENILEIYRGLIK